MSTLTSAQLHVKRSSTRLHAPPGGASSLSFGCGGLGTAEPAEEAPIKDEPAYSRPSSSGRYAPPTPSFSNNSANAPGGYSNYPTTQPGPTPYNHYAPPQQPYQQQSYQQQPYQQQPYQHHNSSPPNSYSYGSSSFSNPSYGNNNSFQGGRPPSSTPSSRSSARSSSSSSSWGSQPPLTSSKRDQNWEKKRRLWMARKNSSSSSSSGSNCGDRPSTSSSTWSSGPAGGPLDDSINPPSPLSKFMHQHSQQQLQQAPPTPGVDYQRLGTASSTRSSTSSGYMNHPSHPQQSYPTQTQMPGAGYPAGGASFSRAGLSTASSTASSTTSSRRQPPGGQCQWSLG
ncbi:hypothetical protein PHYPSEUDO_006665 [Phytophthora pseudosyringae]|uniref:Uncharacterized protein n=1 Tax=Phytophthora pseudosyringae TaxID=221518 RepID=A0A8T1VI30_9STRA|nr:hypothetical protein PHYPSEUDO_006665 [Phytophthora pseudosyringae]